MIDFKSLIIWRVSPLLLCNLVIFALILSISCSEELPTFDGSVSGTVTDKISGTPIAGAEVQLRAGTTTKDRVSTDSDGNYNLTDQVKGEQNYTILSSASGYVDNVIDAFTLTSGNNKKRADIQMDPLTPVLTIIYPDGLERLELSSTNNSNEVRVENSGEGTLTYTLETSPWLDAENSSGNQQGSINGGNSNLITITGNSSEIDKLNLANGESRTAEVVLQTEQEVDGERVIQIRYTYFTNNAPEGEISITPNQSSFLMRESITFEAVNVSDSQDPISELTFSWRFSEEGNFTSPTNNQAITHEFTNPGSFLVSLKITDTDGLETIVSETIQIRENEPPFGGSFTTDVTSSELYVNTPIVFTANNWDDDQTSEIAELEYAWSWGDGTQTSFSSSNISAEHIFSNAETVTVTLYVKDLDNDSTFTAKDFVINSVEQPTVSVNNIEASEVGSNYVNFTGEVIALGRGSSRLLDHGFVYDTVNNVTLENNLSVSLGEKTSIGIFTQRVDGLISSETYYVKSYAINESGVPEYSPEKNFKTTIPEAPEPIYILSIYDILQTTAKFDIRVDNPGLGVTIESFGILVKSSETPSLRNFDIKEENLNTPTAGDYTFEVESLTATTNYKAVAYLTTATGSTFYSNVINFTTN